MLSRLGLSRSTALVDAVSRAAAFSTDANTRNVKVALLGSSGHIGQPLSLLLKSNHRISKLALYDIVHSTGVAADLEHVATPCEVKAYGPNHIGEALEGADLVICAAGQPRKAGQTRQEQFNVNARIIKDLAIACSRTNPNAVYGIISNPVNSTVPLFCEIFHKRGVLDEDKVMGITTLDSQRLQTIIAKEKGWDPSTIYCPVIGGHSGVTIVPVISQCQPHPDLPQERIVAITQQVREAGVQVVEAKHGFGTVTLSIAWAAANFANSIVRAMQGEKGVLECAFVKSDVVNTQYFSSPVEFGENGIAKRFGLPQLNDYEQTLLDECIPALCKYIKAGEDFANVNI